MKRILCLFSFLLLGISLPLRALEVVSIPPLKGLLEDLGLKEVVSIIHPGTDPHTVAISPSHIQVLAKASRVWMVNGRLEVERRLLAVIRENFPQMEVVFLAEGLEFLESDPHQWLSLRNLQAMVSRAGQILGRDPNPLLKDLRDLDRRLSAFFRRQGIKYLLCFHPAWRYFCRDYNLKMVSISDPSGEVRFSRLRQAISGCRQGRYRFVLMESQFARDRLKALVGACPTLPLIAVDPLSEDIVGQFRNLTGRLEALNE